MLPNRALIPIRDAISKPWNPDAEPVQCTALIPPSAWPTGLELSEGVRVPLVAADLVYPAHFFVLHSPDFTRAA